MIDTDKMICIFQNTHSQSITIYWFDETIF